MKYSVGDRYKATSKIGSVYRVVDYCTGKVTCVITTERTNRSEELGEWYFDEMVDSGHLKQISGAKTVKLDEELFVL